MQGRSRKVAALFVHGGEDGGEDGEGMTICNPGSMGGLFPQRSLFRNPANPSSFALRFLPGGVCAAAGELQFVTRFAKNV